MSRIAIAAAFVSAALAAAPLRAAEAWGIEHEKTVVITGRVVDLVCALKGDCPPDCGAGKRQLGLVTPEGQLRAMVKGPVEFAGPVRDLLPFCGKSVQIDGLIIENPAITLVMIQNLRGKTDQPYEWAGAFSKDWEARNGKADEWFRADPLVKEVIGADGVYGIKGLVPPPLAPAAAK